MLYTNLLIKPKIQLKTFSYLINNRFKQYFTYSINYLYLFIKKKKNKKIVIKKKEK